MARRPDVRMAKQPRNVSDRFTLQVALGRAASPQTGRSQTEGLQTKLRDYRIELATKRVRFQSDEVLLVEPLDVRLEHVNDQLLVKPDVMSPFSASARNRLVPPKSHHNKATPTRREDDC